MTSALRTVCFLLAFGLLARAEDVQVRVHGDRTRQAYEGFGATTQSLVYEGRLGDSLGPVLRPKVLGAVYGQVKLTMGNLTIGPLESPGGWDQRRNDNDDPKVIDWRGFNTRAAESMFQHVVRPAAALGFDNYSLQGNINWRWSSPWLAPLYHHDRARCLEECAEQVEAAVLCWKKLGGPEPRTVHLFNEPTSGNGEMHGADAAMIRDVVKRCGDRLRAAGFKEIKFVVPNEETVRRNIDISRVILEDPEARKYVAAIGYHVYPYGSPYASVPRILRASGSGKPDEGSIRERAELRDLCRPHGVPLWMTEVSHSEADPRTLDHLRGRAIHIHDEMVYADASAFYGMMAFWDRKSHADHFAGRGGERPDAYLSEQDSIALADNDAGAVLITGLGYAIGHYARWLTRGALRLDTDSSDPLVLVTALRDDARKRLVLVAINNAPEPRTVRVALSKLGVVGDITGEQSYAHARWEALKPVRPEARDGFQATLPALSVTTLAAPCSKGEL